MSDVLLNFQRTVQSASKYTLHSSGLSAMHKIRTILLRPITPSSVCHAGGLRKTGGMFGAETPGDQEMVIL